MTGAGKPTPSSRSTSSTIKRAEDAVQAGISEVGINSLAHMAKVKLSARAVLVYNRHTMICVGWSNYWAVKPYCSSKLPVTTDKAKGIAVTVP